MTGTNIITIVRTNLVEVPIYKTNYVEQIITNVISTYTPEVATQAIDKSIGWFLGFSSVMITVIFGAFALAAVIKFVTDRSYKKIQKTIKKQQKTISTQQKDIDGLKVQITKLIEDHKKNLEEQRLNNTQNWLAQGHAAMKNGEHLFAVLCMWLSMNYTLGSEIPSGTSLCTCMRLINESIEKIISTGKIKELIEVLPTDVSDQIDKFEAIATKVEDKELAKQIAIFKELHLKIIKLDEESINSTTSQPTPSPVVHY